MATEVLFMFFFPLLCDIWGFFLPIFYDAQEQVDNRDKDFRDGRLDFPLSPALKGKCKIISFFKKIFSCLSS